MFSFCSETVQLDNIFLSVEKHSIEQLSLSTYRVSRKRGKVVGEAAVEFLGRIDLCPGNKCKAGQV